MATASVPIKQLDDITECPICTDNFTEPRVLPCTHTYCLKCIGDYGARNNMDRGDKMPCPLCRTVFVIPADGFVALPRNVFVDKLLEVKKVCRTIDDRKTPCDVCSGSNPGDVEASDASAVMRCMDCRENYCASCCACHRKMKMSATHRMVELGSQAPVEDVVMSRLPAAMCEQHKNKEIEVYCVDCSLAMCVLCYLKLHSQHRCSDLEGVADEFRSQILNDAQNAANRATGIKEIISASAVDVARFVEKVSSIEREIEYAAEEMKAAIDNDKNKLLIELASLKQNAMKQADAVQQECDLQLVALEGFRKYCVEIVEKGTACDVARSTRSLRDRSKELMKFPGIEDSHKSPVAAISVEFSPSNVFAAAAGDLKNCVGSIHISDPDEGLKRQKKSAHISHTDIETTSDVTALCEAAITCDSSACTSVGALTVAGEELYVVRRPNLPGEIEVYDTKTLVKHRSIVVDGLGKQTWGLAASYKNRCVYVSDHDNGVVHAVQIPSGYKTASWKVAKHPTGLTLTASQNILVLSYSQHKLQEFSPGVSPQLVREVKFYTNIPKPYGVVELPHNGFFFISNSGSHASFCDGIRIVDGRGQEAVHRDLVESSALNVRGAILREPRGLAIGEDGVVFIADSGNNRILVLDPKSMNLYQLPVSGELKSPCCVFVDNASGRLYVGESTGGRLLVFNDVANVVRSIPVC